MSRVSKCGEYPRRKWRRFALLAAASAAATFLLVGSLASHAWAAETDFPNGTFNGFGTQSVRRLKFEEGHKFSLTLLEEVLVEGTYQVDGDVIDLIPKTSKAGRQRYRWKLADGKLILAYPQNLTAIEKLKVLDLNVEGTWSEANKDFRSLLVGKWGSKDTNVLSGWKTRFELSKDGSVKEPAYEGAIATLKGIEKEFKTVGRYEVIGDGMVRVAWSIPEMFRGFSGEKEFKTLWINVTVSKDRLSYEEVPYRGEFRGVPVIKPEDLKKATKQTLQRKP